MKSNKALKLKEAWLQAMSDILFSEEAHHVEDYLEVLNYSTSFSFEDIYELQSDNRIDSDYIEMKKVFFTSETNRFGHSYANTIINPIQSISDPILSISSILSKNKTTRKAVLTFAPYGDEKIPCINSIQFLVRQNKLNIIYYSRGQDMFRKFPCDAMCIASIGEEVAKKNGYSLGIIFANISSSHIYDRDINIAKEYIVSSRKEKYIILTGNPDKYSNYIDTLKEHNIELLIKKIELPEIQSDNCIDVVKAKAKYAYEEFGFPVWIDDMSLSLDAYPLFPGPYTKSIFKQIGIKGLQKLLHNDSNKGTIICRLCSFDGNDYHIIEGENKGYFDFTRPIENPKMPLNSIFIGEGIMEHRNKVIAKLIEYREKYL